MMSRIAKAGAALAAMLALAGCATAPVLDAAAGRKPFVPEQFFRGPTYAQGEFVNVIDGSKRGVKAIINGRFDGRALILVGADQDRPGHLFGHARGRHWRSAGAARWRAFPADLPGQRED